MTITVTTKGSVNHPVSLSKDSRFESSCYLSIDVSSVKCSLISSPCKQKPIFSEILLIVANMA